MVSRRKILSRSRDDLNLDEVYHPEEEEDIWYQKEKLYKDHIQEVLDKWSSIDDEIWAKVIVLERNRRVAKAYARAPVLTVNGSEDGFDGFRIGVNGFDNPMRDPKTEEFKKLIGLGCKIKMDETGHILIKRFSPKSSIYIKNTIEENAVSNDILKLPNGLLELEKPFKLFDMKKFQQNVNRELKRNFPDRKKLEYQCISTIAFVKNEPELLDSPIWIMLINVVALEMLRAKMPVSGVSPGTSANVNRAAGSNNGARKRFTASGSSDEDPYSLTPSGSSGSSGKGNQSREEPPRLPSREKEYYGPQNWAKHHRQHLDYSDDMDEENTLNKKQNSRLRNGRNKSSDDPHRKTSAATSSGDDPYYCGLRARVPNFVQQQQQSSRKDMKNKIQPQSKMPLPSRSAPNLQNIAQLPGPHPFWWHSRLYPDSGVGASSSSVATSNGGHFPMAYRPTNELSSYHYPGRNRGYRNSMTTFAATAAATAGPQPGRPVYRTGWE